MSCLYGIIQVYVLVMYMVDIDMHLWKLFNPRYAESTEGLQRYVYGAFFRLKGWSSEPNVLASVIITALPALYAIILFGKNRYVRLVQGAIVTATMVLTQSLSGILGTMVSMGTVGVLCFKRLRRIDYRFLFIPLIPILIFTFVFREEAFNIAAVKLSPDGTIANHARIMIESAMLITANPVGVGASNFSLIYESATGEAGKNPHSTWIIYLVEQGWLGFVYQLFFSIYIMLVCLRKKSFFSKIFLGSYLGVCVSSIFYETLELFLSIFLWRSVLQSSSDLKEKVIIPG